MLYQVVWVRQLEILVGSSTLAATAVISSFMSGLAIGAALATRIIPRLRSPVAAFSLVQLTIGIFALIFPDLLASAQPVINHFYNSTTGSYALAIFVIAFFLLLIPTIAMGSTFSLMLKILGAGQADAKAVALAYGANTLGAATGAFIAGFVLLGLYGMRFASLTGISLNLILALTMGTIHFFSRSSQSTSTEPTTIPSGHSALSATGYEWRYFVATFLLGFAGMAYEILVIRYSMYFLPYVYNNVYLFPAVVFAFCAWLGAGSYISGKISGQRLTQFLPFGLMVQGLYMAFSSHIFLQFDMLNDFFCASHVYNLFFKANLLLFVPAFLSGFSFPGLCQHVMTVLPVKAAAFFFTSNTIGSIFGPLTATFLLIPVLGLQKAFVLTGIFPILVILLINKTNPGTIAFIALSMTLALILFPTNMIHIPEEGHELVIYQENRDATAIVTRDQRGELSLHLNDHEAAGTDYTHFRNQIMMALVPLAAHPAPEKVLVICLGTGVTAGTSFADDRVKNVTTVEISSSVEKLLPVFYPWNGLEKIVKDSSRFNLIIDDGRSFITNSTEKFDIITSEPLHPKRAGTVNLYSQEYYQHCKARLNNGGIVAQWLPYHAMTLEEFKAIIFSFASSFKYSRLWIGEQGVMIGSNSPIELKEQQIINLLQKPAVATLIAKGGYNPELFFGGFWLNQQGMKNYTGQEIKPLTDDLPWIEYSLDGSDHDVYTPMLACRQSPQELFTELNSHKKTAENGNLANVDFLNYRIAMLSGDQQAAIQAAARLKNSKFMARHFLKLLETGKPGKTIAK